MARPLTIGSAAAIVIGIAVVAWVVGASGEPESAAPTEPKPVLLAEVTDSAPPVLAELLSDVEIIQPGNVFRLGVRLTMQPGWHVVAPGDTAATTVDFHLPDRYRVGPARWPAPVPFTQPDGTMASGYRDRVVMYREVRASNLDPDHDWHLSARVAWLACQDACEPGETTVDLWLPASISGTRLQHWRNIRLFDEWSPRLVLERP